MKHGFSLVELSIVLVILGLLTGGILAGQSLIQSAETRKITTDITKFATAARTFRDKYMADPGDMPNATKFWGATDPDKTVCRVTPGTGTNTCDGDGNGQVGQPWPEQYETLFIWKHLANAGLVAGNLTGVTYNPAYRMGHMPGVNCPMGPDPSSCFGMFEGGTQLPGHAYMWPGNYGLMIEYGNASGNWDPAVPGVSAHRTWNIDTKLDDGKPGTGRVITRAGAAQPECTAETNTNNAATATYKLDSTQQNACSIYYLRI